MKHWSSISLILAASVMLPLLATAATPDVTPRIEAVIDRQVERAQLQAEQRLPEVVDQAQERVAAQAQERVAEQARQKATEQIQQRTAVQVEDRAAGQVQNRAAEQVEDRAAVQVDGRAIDQIRDNAAARIEGRGIDQLPDAAANRVQNAQRGVAQSLSAPPLPAPAVPGAGQPASTPQRPDSVIPSDRLAQTDQTDSYPFVEIMIEPNIRVLEREWVMLLTNAQREVLAADSPELMRYHVQTSPFETLDSYLLRFRVPPGLDSTELIQQMVPETMRELLDRNHIYSTQKGNSQLSDELPLPMSSICEDPVSIGMIDTAVDRQNIAFAARTGRAPGLISRHFIAENIETPVGHGTAIAGILVGQGSGFNPLLPNGTLYSASVVYSQGENHQGVTVIHLLEALDWLISQDVLVINMSLTGPANRLLERGVNAAFAKGKVIVAAAGNHGPHAPVSYPAAYENVITATAVASDRSIYRWANQGKHIDFAAIGVFVPTAGDSEDVTHESGTSMAAPVVSAFMACALATYEDHKQAFSMLKRRAVDLGEPGHDPIFGYGLLHP